MMMGARADERSGYGGHVQHVPIRKQGGRAHGALMERGWTNSFSEPEQAEARMQARIVLGSLASSPLTATPSATMSPPRASLGLGGGGDARALARGSPQSRRRRGDNGGGNGEAGSTPEGRRRADRRAYRQQTSGVMEHLSAERRRLGAESKTMNKRAALLQNHARDLMQSWSADMERQSNNSPNSAEGEGHVGGGMDGGGGGGGDDEAAAAAAAAKATVREAPPLSKFEQIEQAYGLAGGGGTHAPSSPTRTHPLVLKYERSDPHTLYRVDQVGGERHAVHAGHAGHAGHADHAHAATGAGGAGMRGRGEKNDFDSGEFWGWDAEGGMYTHLQDSAREGSVPGGERGGEGKEGECEGGKEENGKEKECVVESTEEDRARAVENGAQEAMNHSLWAAEDASRNISLSMITPSSGPGLDDALNELLKVHFVVPSVSDNVDGGGGGGGEGAVGGYWEDGGRVGASVAVAEEDNRGVMGAMGVSGSLGVLARGGRDGEMTETAQSAQSTIVFEATQGALNALYADDDPGDETLLGIESVPLSGTRPPSTLHELQPPSPSPSAHLFGSRPGTVEELRHSDPSRPSSRPSSGRSSRPSSRPNSRPGTAELCYNDSPGPMGEVLRYHRSRIVDHINDAASEAAVVAAEAAATAVAEAYAQIEPVVWQGDQTLGEVAEEGWRRLRTAVRDQKSSGAAALGLGTARSAAAAALVLSSAASAPTLYSRGGPGGTGRNPGDANRSTQRKGNKRIGNGIGNGNGTGNEGEGERSGARRGRAGRPPPRSRPEDSWFPFKKNP